MFESYKATKEDFRAIEEGLKTVWSPKMRFVFRDPSKIAGTIVISYDSGFIYLWSPKQIQGLEKLGFSLKRYFVYRISHKLKLEDEWQYAWCTGIWDKKMEKLLPKKIQQATHFKIPRISGGLLTPFIKIHQEGPYPLDAYNTKESFLATIVHEFGHVYWSQYKLWWYSNKKENLHYLNSALKLYQGKKIPHQKLKFPTSSGIHELYAFCAEYEASSIFWPSHQQNLDIFIKNRLERSIEEEKRKDLDKEDSAISPSNYPHDFAFVFGKIILNHYPKTWPEILISPKILRLMP